MRLIMMGTGAFAVPTFNSLLDSTHEVAALVTRPVAPARGRQKFPANPMRDVAQRRGVDVLAPDNVNDDRANEQLDLLAADLLVVCDYGQILKKQTLQTARLGGINLHASLLPKYRGAAPINWAIYHGETVTGVTVIHMSPKMDAGPCLVQRETEIGRDETAEDLEPRLAKLGIEPVHDAISMLECWDGRSQLGTVQDPAQATRAPRLSKSDGAVDWSRSAEQIRDQVRAMKPWPGSYTFWHRPDTEPMRLILDWVSVVHEPSIVGEPGTAAAVGADRLWIATIDGLLSVDRIQPAGKRVMSIDEFLCGHPVAVGDRFGPL